MCFSLHSGVGSPHSIRNAIMRSTCFSYQTHLASREWEMDVRFVTPVPDEPRREGHSGAEKMLVGGYVHLR
jgi:hypothetical protein